MLKFMIVTLLSWIVGLAVFVVMMRSEPQAAVRADQRRISCGDHDHDDFSHRRYVRTQREFIVRQYPWRDFIFSSLAEWAACSLTAVYLGAQMKDPYPLPELFLIPFTAAMLVRYILRKEFLLDLRGLRRDLRQDNWLSRIESAHRSRRPGVLGSFP